MDIQHTNHVISSIMEATALESPRCLVFSRMRGKLWVCVEGVCVCQ